MNNPLQLPPRTGSAPLTIEADVRRIIIIGANGSGKTRFTRRLADDLGAEAFRLSALTALFRRVAAETTPTAIDSLYEAMLGIEAAEPQRRLTSELERLLAMLMHDEMLNLIAYKVYHAADPAAELQPSMLDKVVAVWQQIFPDNHILTESGRMLFTRGLDKGAYSAVRLSTGERAVIYYIGALLYAPENSVVIVDNPDMFLHPSILQTVWNTLEQLRPDCRFVYTTHDLEFASSRTDAALVWVRDCDVAAQTWTYDRLPRRQGLPDEVYLAIIGSRKPIIFIEGDSERSIDAKLYPLVFKDYTVKSMGSCNKVIEATRSFNDLAAFHHLDSHGIVDRDRRDDKEVEYLRRKKIFVPDVAEIENILMLEEVVRTVASNCGRDEEKVFDRVRRTIISLFRGELHQQALQHTRHRVKRLVEYRIDGRFSDIGMLEQHMADLTNEINPRGMYEAYCRDFRRYVDSADYKAVLRVFNQKSMVPSSNVAEMCGLRGKDDYVARILRILRENGRDAERMRRAILACFGINPDAPAAPASEITETTEASAPGAPASAVPAPSQHHHARAEHDGGGNSRNFSKRFNERKKKHFYHKKKKRNDDSSSN